MLTSWRRRSTRSMKPRWVSLGKARIGGRRFCANSASTRASMRSLLAKIPIPRAKSRTCLGLTTAMGTPAAASTPAKAVSYPPEASTTHKQCLLPCTQAKHCCNPQSVFSKRWYSPSGKLKASTLALLTSKPTKLWASLLIPSLSIIRGLLPCNRSGLNNELHIRHCALNSPTIWTMPSPGFWTSYSA